MSLALHIGEVKTFWYTKYLLNVKYLGKVGQEKCQLCSHMRNVFSCFYESDVSPVYISLHDFPGDIEAILEMETYIQQAKCTQSCEIFWISRKSYQYLYMKRIPKTLSILKSNLQQTLELRLSNVKETKVPLLRAAVDLLHSDGSNRQLNTHLRLKVAAQSQKSRFQRNRENETSCRFQKQPMPLPKFLYTPTVLRDEQEKERKSSQEKQIKDALDFIDPETTGWFLSNR